MAESIFDETTLRLYKSEMRLRDVHENFYDSELGESPTLTLVECQEFVDKILGTGKNKVWVRDGRGHDWARVSRDSKGRPVIELPKWARNEYVILHECSHWLSIRQTGVWGDHGQLFASYLLLLVRYVLGREDYDCLLAEYKRHGVLYYDLTRPRRKPGVAKASSKATPHLKK